MHCSECTESKGQGNNANYEHSLSPPGLISDGCELIVDPRPTTFTVSLPGNPLEVDRLIAGGEQTKVVSSTTILYQHIFAFNRDKMKLWIWNINKLTYFFR